MFTYLVQVRTGQVVQGQISYVFTTLLSCQGSQQGVEYALFKATRADCFNKTISLILPEYFNISIC